MKNITRLFLILISYERVDASTVDQLFLKSLKGSKQIEIINLEKEKALSDLDTMSSSLFPSLDLVSVNKYESSVIDNSAVKNELDTQIALSLNQKLFQGGSEFAINDYRKLIPKRAQAQKKLEISKYYQHFTTLYFKLSSATEEMKKIKSLLSNLKERVLIVRKRTRIGKDRRADFYALESQLYRLKADLVTSTALVKSAKTNFINYSGLTSTEGVKDSINPLSLSLLKEISIEEIPSVDNLKLDYESSQFETRIEESSNYPQVDLGLNYFVDKSRLGRNDWEVSLNLKLNLLDFGGRSSKITSKKMTSLIRKSQYDYSRVNSKREWNNFVNNFEAKKQELTSLRTALKRSQASYQEQLKDLKKGLITQLDVIRSLDDVISLEKLSIRSSLEIKSLYYQALAYLGNYPKG